MRWSAATDIGLVRVRNEDRFWASTEHGVFLVVDGLGGHSAGEFAAQTAVDEISSTLIEGASDICAEDRIRAAITRANNRIFELAQQNEAHHGMACVLTLALVEGNHIIVGHVGDSRLYLAWYGGLRKLTSDHSPVGEAEDAGELDEEEAMRHPRRNEVFRDVGSRQRTGEEEDFIEIRKFRFRPDAAFLLCSDGITDQLTTSRVREILERFTGDVGSVVRDLVEAANEAGGRDNATALFVAGPQFGSGRDATRARSATIPRHQPPRLFTGRMALLTYGLVLGMLVWAVLKAVRG
jgi:serine/threonine protein phosphatase PrpC